MIHSEMTINQVLELDSDLIYVFENSGIKGLTNASVLKQVGSMTLKSLFSVKKIDGEQFMQLLNETIAEKESSDITLNKATHTDGQLNIVGLLPCPVRVPLMEAFAEFEGADEVNHTLKAASEGLDWLKESVESANDESDLADMYMSAGFDLFFEDHLMKKFKDKGTFTDLSGLTKYNSDFENDSVSLRDPRGEYSMLAVVPAVFLINKRELGDLPIPRTWADLLDPIYEKRISLPVSDFDLFNAILLHIHKEFGESGVRQLGKSLFQSMHPSQMVKSQNKTARPAISIMPFFFSRMAREGGVMEAVWPSDGAIISPIFMLTKGSKSEELRKVSEFFSSKKVGEILSHQGLFPSVNPEVDNHLDGKPLKWVGWDYINNNNIGALLKRCDQVFTIGTGVVPFDL